MERVKLVEEIDRRLRAAGSAGRQRFAGQSTSTAMEVIGLTVPDMRAIRRDLIGRGMDNWNSVDTFACYVAGRCWRQGQVGDAAVRGWARSRDRWWRRAAVVSTVPLNQKAHGGSGDTARTIDLCARVAGDRDDMVVKGLSWALRTLAGHDVHARVRREVRNKATGRKNR